MGSSQGLGPWLLQRFSGLYLALFFIYVILGFLLCGPESYQEWRDWIGAPGMNIAAGLFFLALAIHSWVGIRDVILDYVPPVGLRITVLVLLAVSLLGCLLWSWRILLLAAL
jgi:succinate dehydrogenase / fumarate reductase membrane anchor subunit